MEKITEDFYHTLFDKTVEFLQQKGFTEADLSEDDVADFINEACYETITVVYKQIQSHMQRIANFERATDEA